MCGHYGTLPKCVCRLRLHTQLCWTSLLAAAVAWSVVTTTTPAASWTHIQTKYSFHNILFWKPCLLRLALQQTSQGQWLPHVANSWAFGQMIFQSAAAPLPSPVVNTAVQLQTGAEDYLTDCPHDTHVGKQLLTGYRTQTRASSNWSGGATPSACKPHAADMYWAVPCSRCSSRSAGSVPLMQCSIILSLQGLQIWKDGILIQPQATHSGDAGHVCSVVKGVGEQSACKTTLQTCPASPL
jgi:hypothetical protein